MPYNPNPSLLCIADFSMARDWRSAPPGKWFIGVIDTVNSKVYLVPSNIHDSPLLTRGNNQPRQMNRYASGAPGEAAGKGDGVAYETYRRGNWITDVPGTTVHHARVAEHYGLDPTACVAFTLIKISLSGAQLKLSSGSFHLPLADALQHHSFSAQTFLNRPGFAAGTPQMPTVWRVALQRYLSGYPLNVAHLAVSQE